MIRYLKTHISDAMVVSDGTPTRTGSGKRRIDRKSHVSGEASGRRECMLLGGCLPISLISAPISPRGTEAWPAATATSALSASPPEMPAALLLVPLGQTLELLTRLGQGTIPLKNKG